MWERGEGGERRRREDDGDGEVKIGRGGSFLVAVNILVVEFPLKAFGRDITELSRRNALRGTSLRNRNAISRRGAASGAGRNAIRMRDNRSGRRRWR